MPITELKKQPVASREFTFGEAATLYARHIDLVTVLQESSRAEAKKLTEKYEDVVRQMRLETFRSITQFGDLLVEQLLNLQLGHKKTVPQGQYGGGKLNYFWREKSKKWGDVAKVMVPIPDSTKVKPENDRTWKDVWGSFEPLLNHRLKVWVAGGETEDDSAILEVVKDSSLGTYLEEEYWAHTMLLPLRPDDPVGSAAQALHALILRLP